MRIEDAHAATKVGDLLTWAPGWAVSACGCCGGLQWGGDYPRECRDCRGGGVVFVHLSTGAVAEYPGGPFNGDRRPDLEVRGPA